MPQVSRLMVLLAQARFAVVSAVAFHRIAWVLEPIYVPWSLGYANDTLLCADIK